MSLPFCCARCARKQKCRPCARPLTEKFLPPFNLHNGHSATLSLSVGYALAWEHATAESLQELADQNMYRMKNQRIQQTLK